MNTDAIKASEVFKGPSGYRWTILGIATIAQASSCFLVQGLGALGGYIQQSLHLQSSEIGLLMSAAQLAPILGLLVAGELLDRLGERAVVGVGALIVAAALAGASLASSFVPLLLWLILLGAGYSAAQPGGSKAVSAWFPKTQRGFAMGIRQAGLPLGGALAAATLPFVVHAHGLQAGFILGAVVAGAGGLLFIAFYHAPSATNAKIKNPSKGMSRLVAERWRTLAQPALRPIIVSGVALITAQYGIVLWVVLYLRDIFHIASERAALCLFLAQMAGVVGRISLAAWSDRCAGGRYRPVQVSIIALVGGFAALPSATAAGAPAAVIWMIIAWLGFFGLGWYGPWVAYVSEAAPPDQTGFTLGAVMAINQIAIVSTPPIIGTIIDRSGSYSLVWLCLSALMALAFVGARSAKASGSKKN